jgi:hypothetical protein
MAKCAMQIVCDYPYLRTSLQPAGGHREYILAT